jgi:hypothetical protein
VRDAWACGLASVCVCVCVCCILDALHRTASRKCCACSPQADYRIECRASASSPLEARYLGLLIYASLATLVYPVGVPCLYAFLLHRHWNEIAGFEKERAREVDDEAQRLLEGQGQGQRTPSSSARSVSVTAVDPGEAVVVEPAPSPSSPLKPLSSLFEPFSPEARYFALVEVARRVLYAALQCTLQAGSNGQLMSVLLLSLFYLTLLYHYQPYREAGSQTLAVVASWQINFTVIGTVAQKLASRPSVAIQVGMFVCHCRSPLSVHTQ